MMDLVTAQESKDGGRFPVPLLCPECGNVAELNSVCARTRRPCVSDFAGIPRFLFGQKYWGEISSEKMHLLLRRAKQVHWRSALVEVAGNEALSQHLLSPIRADVLHAMPWCNIKKVLDIGAGMGFMSCDMARYAESVVSLEAVPERAEFLQIRARQDSLSIFPIIANAMAPPFPAESFDLITLNGTFEYLGLWGKGDPRTVQETFLDEALRLLKPGGYLYIGVETRFGASEFLGRRDHSGLAFTSIMPRSVANLYCRLRSRHFYGSEHVADGYRTYTYTPSQYSKMLLRAGFSRVLMQGVFDGYNRQNVLYNIHDRTARKAVLDRINPAASVAGLMRRTFTENRLVYRIFEDEVVMLGRKSPCASNDLLWAEVSGAQHSVIQVNLPFKILGVLCEGGRPFEILEVEKQGETAAAARLEYSFSTLQKLQQRLGPEAPSLPIRWPAPRGTQIVSGRTYRRYEYIAGQSLSTMLLPLNYTQRKALQTIKRAVEAYVSLCARLSDCFPRSAPEANWPSIETQLANIEVGSDIREAFCIAVAKAKSSGWPLSAVHGDFTAGNLIVTPSGQFVLIDWEHFAENYFVGADLIRFFQDAIIDSSRLPARVRRPFRLSLRESVTEGLQSCGHIPSDFKHLQALYIGQQIAALGGESRVYPPLLEEYRRAQFALTPVAETDAL